MRWYAPVTMTLCLGCGDSTDPGDLDTHVFVGTWALTIDVAPDCWPVPIAILFDVAQADADATDPADQILHLNSSR